MRNREPFKLKSLFLIHNFYLTAISAILLALFVEQLLPIVVRKGVFHAICDHEGGWTQPLITLYYVYLNSCFCFAKREVAADDVCAVELSDEVS